VIPMQLSRNIQFRDLRRTAVALSGIKTDSTVLVVLYQQLTLSVASSRYDRQGRGRMLLAQVSQLAGRHRAGAAPQVSPNRG
jgi:hypothetical protein